MILFIIDKRNSNISTPKNARVLEQLRINSISLVTVMPKVHFSSRAQSGLYSHSQE
jgi:hypothetical protein